MPDSHDVDTETAAPLRSRSGVLGFVRWLVETTLLTFAAFVVAMAIRATVAEAVYIPSASMESTIMTWDRAVVEKVTYRFRSPEPGEIVTVDDPSGRFPMLIKRVIAVGGQTVDMRDGVVYVDGEPLDEPYTHELPSLPSTVQLPLTVPDGYVWLMGDNRTNSTDSRAFGPQPVSAVHARALAIYWPLEHIGALAGE